MSKRHTIPTEPVFGFGPDHFKSDAILLVKGSNRSGGPGGWYVGGWGAAGAGRKVFGGPHVPGPYAYVNGHPGVISRHPGGGTRGEHERARTEGRLFEVEPGDVLEIYGTDYTLTLCPRGYPNLTPVA